MHQHGNENAFSREIEYKGHQKGQADQNQCETPIRLDVQPLRRKRALEIQNNSPHRDDTGLRTSLAWLYRAEGKDGEAERLLTEGTERSEKTGEKKLGKFLNLKTLAEQYQD